MLVVYAFRIPPACSGAHLRFAAGLRSGDVNRVKIEDGEPEKVTNRKQLNKIKTLRGNEITDRSKVPTGDRITNREQKKIRDVGSNRITSCQQDQYSGGGSGGEGQDS